MRSEHQFVVVANAIAPAVLFSEAYHCLLTAATELPLLTPLLTAAYLLNTCSPPLACLEFATQHGKTAHGISMEPRTYNALAPSHGLALPGGSGKGAPVPVQPWTRSYSAQTRS